MNDPRAGAFEGGRLDEYRDWAWAAGSSEPVPGGGESRLEVVTRCAAAYRALLDRPEASILAVVHALPIAYLLAALEGEPPAARMDRPVEYAVAHPSTPAAWTARWPFSRPGAPLRPGEVLKSTPNE